jgi:hypothetical protein
MTGTLRPALVTPTHHYLTRMLAVGFGCGLLGAVVTLAAHPTPAVVALAPPAPQIASTEPVRVPITPVEPAPLASPSAQLLFVFRAGNATYVKLADLEADALPKHGKLKLSDGESTSAVATVHDSEVPAAYQGWTGKQVIVDGRCTASVTGYAVVGRLTGDPGYAGVAGEHWTASTVMAQGAIVLAARIDRCSKGVYARDAALAPIIVPDPVKDEALAEAAKSALLASDVAKQAAAEWSSTEQEGTWQDHAEFDTRVVRHPVTGVTWVAVHGNLPEMGCGGPDINVWGLFRVDPDGTLVPVELRKLDELYAIDSLLDVDGDGQLEVLGRPWLGLDVVLAHASGEPIDRLRLPFFGCPC